MKKELLKLLEGTNTLTIENIVMNLLVAVVISFVIYVSYVLSHRGTLYSKKFNVSLVMLTVLTSMVMTVIGNNVALSLGMVGALSIVRFRTAIKDSRDTTYIFWAIIVGICTGVGDYLVAGIGTSIVFLLLLILGTIKNDGRVLLIIKSTLNNERKIEGVVYDFFENNANLKVKNTTKTSIEFIYEISHKTLNKVKQRESSISEELYKLKGVEYVNLVKQNDEVSA